MSRRHLISGATSGIGAAIAQRLLSEGDEVIPIVRSKSDALRMGAQNFILCDFNHPEKVRQACLELDFEIDSFINAAGIAIGKPIWDTDEIEARQMLNVNLISPMFACGALRNNLRSGGSIILFSSQSAFRGGWDDLYNVSKGGINTFIKSFAIKVAPDIRVIGIAPGITENTRMTLGRKNDDLDRIRATIPLKRFANVDEIAALTFALLSDAGSYMTGSVVDVNGGNYLR
jgi:NAD(P)-dependent dehydrogenase (short-subunit alcohol dehydrogenase family)